MQVSSIALHSHVAVERLSAMNHLLSPAINRIHFTAGTKAGCLPGPDTSLLLMEAGMKLSLILEMQTKPNVSQAWQDQPVLVLLYTSHGISEDAAGLGVLGPSTTSSLWQMPHVCQHCQMRWGFICAWAAAGL